VIDPVLAGSIDSRFLSADVAEVEYPQRSMRYGTAQSRRDRD
jgi:hypothetical protein